MNNDINMSDNYFLASPKLSKLEYFTAMAMMGILSKHGVGDEWEIQIVSMLALSQAKSVLKVIENDGNF